MKSDSFSLSVAIPFMSRLKILKFFSQRFYVHRAMLVICIFFLYSPLNIFAKINDSQAAALGGHGMDRTEAQGGLAVSWLNDSDWGLPQVHLARTVSSDRPKQIGWADTRRFGVKSFEMGFVYTPISGDRSSYDLAAEFPVDRVRRLESLRWKKHADKHKSTIPLPDLKKMIGSRELVNRFLPGKEWKRERKRRRRKRSYLASDVKFSCMEEAEERELRELWKRDKKAAALEYVEIAWEDAKLGTCLANCTMHLDYQPIPLEDLDVIYRQQMVEIWHMTNVLANIFRLQEAQSTAGVDSMSQQEGLIVALVRGFLSSNLAVAGVSIALLHQDEALLEATVSSHLVVLSVYRSSVAEQLRVENVTWKEPISPGKRQHDPWDNQWFWDVTNKVGSAKTQESKFCRQESSLEDMVIDEEVTFLSKSKSFGVWGLPFFDCSTHRTWSLHYAVPLFGCSSQKLTLRGVLKVDLDLANVNINQCSENGIFGGTHRCPNNSQCVPLLSKGFHRGSYQCQCLPGYYASNASLVTGSLFDFGYIRRPLDDVGEYDATGRFICLPCKFECELCRETAPCQLQYDILIRGIPMGIESLCVTISLALTVAIIRLRKTKVMKASFWCLLEIITLGSLLLHATVIIQYFEPTDLSCLFIPWLREVGFAIVYGALILKVYRVLAEFQSRKAHRVQVRDKDLFKYLCCIVIVVVGYMAAWTAVTIDRGNRRTTLLQYSYTRDHLMYTMCQSTWWDYVVEVGEFLFMAFSIYICYRSRSAPSSYGEVRFITLAIYNETIISAAFYITRHFLLFTIHPDYIFLMYFIRCQLTVSITMLLILGPKIWYSHQPPEESANRNRAFSSSDAQESIASPAEVVKLNTTLNPNGDVEVGEISLADMNPEDIKAELKRLYTQLQIYKTKTMRQDNPHISKRRGGRKQTHRRFSLQPFHNKHRHHQCSEHGEHGGSGTGGGGVGVPGGETEISRTPEESTNSAEGVSIYMDETSVTEIPRVPTVTFRPSGNKAK